MRDTKRTLWKNTNMRTEYVDEDLIAYANGEVSLEYLMNKYHVSKVSIYKALSKRKLHKKKTPILIRTGDRKIICDSIRECAKEIGVSPATILTALKGKETILDKLGIKVEVYHAKKETSVD